MEFYDAWGYLYNHPKYKDEYNNSKFLECTDISVVKVNPQNNTIEDDEKLNTKTRIWLETGEYNKESGFCYHEIDLDCGGDTYEEAIIKLSGLMKEGNSNV